MEPDASTLAAGGPVDIDITKIGPGQQIIARWRNRPIFIVNRPPDALKVLQETQMANRLADPQSAQHQQPPYARNWHRSIKPEFGVLVGICTHLGCIPLFYPTPNATQPAADWLGGCFCPCHGSKYDLAGRVYEGVPAPYNLPVPPYRFVNDKTVRMARIRRIPNSISRPFSRFSRAPGGASYRRTGGSRVKFLAASSSR